MRVYTAVLLNIFNPLLLLKCNCCCWSQTMHFRTFTYSAIIVLCELRAGSGTNTGKATKILRKHIHGTTLWIHHRIKYSVICRKLLITVAHTSSIPSAIVWCNGNEQDYENDVCSLLFTELQDMTVTEKVMGGTYEESWLNLGTDRRFSSSPKLAEWSWDHLASYTMDTGTSYPGNRASWAWKWPTTV